MTQSVKYGSVRGAAGNSRPYRERPVGTAKTSKMTHNGHRPASLVAAAKSLSAPIKALI